MDAADAVAVAGRRAEAVGEPGPHRGAASHQPLVGVAAEGGHRPGQLALGRCPPLGRLGDGRGTNRELRMVRSRGQGGVQRRRSGRPIVATRSRRVAVGGERPRAAPSTRRRSTGRRTGASPTAAASPIAPRRPARRQRRRAGEARIGEEGARPRGRGCPRLEQPEELEDQPLAQHDRGVRLLDAERPRGQALQRAGWDALGGCLGGADELERGRRRSSRRRSIASARRVAQAAPSGTRYRSGGTVGGEAHLDDGEGGIEGDGGAMGLDDRGDREMLRAEPAGGDDLLGRHPDPSSPRSPRKRTIGQGTSPSTQWWSATSMARPMRG